MVKLTKLVKKEVVARLQLFGTGSCVLLLLLFP